MSGRAIIMMVIVLGSMWGGFAFLLWQAMRKGSPPR